MAINYADKFSNIVDERFNQASMTAGAINSNYDWLGVESVKVFSIPTSAMNNYSLTGSSRYGTPDELENQVQEMKISQDRAFTFSIDRKSYDDTIMTMEAGAALRRQIDEVVVPELDMYRLAKIAAGADPANITSASPITASNAYEAMLDADVALTNALAPMQGRIAFVSPNYYKYIKLDTAFIKQSDLSQNMMINGVIGMVDNVLIVRVPTAYLPTSVEFILTHPVATVGVQKLTDYIVHDNPVGINGWLVEGRLRYDAFVLDSKKGAIYVHQG